MIARRAFEILLLCAPLLLTGCGGRPWNVLLVTFDTTRADFLGCYGKDSARTPHLDGLAAEGYLFEHAYASNPVTQPSHSTILTGVYPMVHGVRDNTFFHLPDERQTLAETLSEHGYATGAAIGGFPLTREFGTAQGFDFYDDDLTANRLDHRGRPAQRRFATWYDERPAAHVNDAIRPWLRERRGEPFFVWLHYWDPHEPHIAPPPYGELFANDPYQGEIAYADESLGAILRQLDEQGELERTLVVMTADHGEGRLEHDEMTHAFLAYNTTLNVPLIIRVPGRQGGRRIAERVGTVDIVPTILDLLGFGVPPELQGRSLAPLMFGQRTGRPSWRPYYSESLSPRLSHGAGELRALFLGPWKYIYGPRPELFDLERDPRELEDLAAERPEERQRMEAALRRFLDEHADPEAASATYEADEETRRRLAALGYVSTSAEEPEGVSEVLRGDGIPPQDQVGNINLQGRLRAEINAGRYAAALPMVLELLEIDPDNAFFRASLAAVYMGLGETDKAVRVVEETPRASAANVAQFLGVAQALVEAGESQRGLAMARRLVEADETAAGRLVLARMLLEAGDGGGFEAQARRALELDDDNRDARLELAGHLLEEGRLEEAESQFRSLLASHPIDLEGLLGYSRALRRSGRPEAALASAERAARLAPAWCEALLERLELLVEVASFGDVEGAAAQLRQRCRGERETMARVATLMEEVG